MIFDRIREVRGKNPDLTVPMINDSVNQTLGLHAALTSGTVLLATLILYFSLAGRAFIPLPMRCSSA